jgi:hypothetical protein
MALADMVMMTLMMLLQGMLAIGAALLGSPCVLGLDVDPDALEVAQDNCEQFEDPLPVRYSPDALRDSLGVRVAGIKACCVGSVQSMWGARAQSPGTW